MLSVNDFEKKQIIVVFFNEKDKIYFKNDNIVVKDCDEKIKLQVSCYRVFLIFAVGNFSITSVVLQKAKKFGFNIALFTPTYRLIDVIGFDKNSNTLLRKRQYEYTEIDIAKLIVKNKIYMQIKTLNEIRNKNGYVKEAILTLNTYIKEVDTAGQFNKILAYEGLSAKIYFRNHFNDIGWNGRQPRIKRDYINSALDIGYTVLFAFIESILIAFGFDLYYGVLHKQFYTRKSLVCDMVEPFRCIIDRQLKKSINLKQIKESDFRLENLKYQLKWENSPKYTEIFMKSILAEKREIFNYIKMYNNAFMKDKDIENYPFYKGECYKGERDCDNN